MVPPATLADVVAHIDHIVKIAGIDAVGIGSDFDGVFCTPAGLEDRFEVPEPDARAARKRLFRRGHPQNLWREYSCA